ncbi:MAG TPA: alpha/beta hydrolase [Chloroflexota bacterium]|nr:alpha/beta hydrolase [Chloroflexota bacterium]
MSDTTLRSRFVMAGHIKTHYVEAGANGPVVVLLHGGGPGSGGEAGFGRLIPYLAERYRVYAPDGVGGFGETDPSAPADQGTQSRVDQLEAFMDALCLDDACVAGNSQGAWVAAKYAIQHPERVRRLFLVASLTIGGAMGLQTPITEGLKALNSYDGTEASMRRVMEALVFDKSVVTDELIRMRNEAANRPGAAEARKAAEAGQKRLTSELRIKFDMRHTLPNLPIPTMFAWGENDTFAPPELGRELQKLLPNIPFHFIPNAAHQAQTDQPEALARLMIQHFES